MSLRTKYRLAKWILRHPKRVRNILKKEYRADKKRIWARHLQEEQCEVIRASEFFDEEWFVRNNLEVQTSTLSPVEFFLKHGQSRYMPSPYFSCEEYNILHSDVQHAKLNPLLHYETYGKREGRDIYLREVEVDAIVFPSAAKECNKDFLVTSVLTRRMAIVSCFFADGKMPETLLYLLRGLKEVVDNIILIGDCWIIPSELEKLNGLACYAEFTRHGQYDFGSYKRGLEYVRRKNLFEKTETEEVVFINDSCYGPVFPFSESFNQMSNHYCDFWGYTSYGNAQYEEHIQSSFIVFKRNIIYTDLLDSFLSRLKGEYDRGAIIALCETQLTGFLVKEGFFYSIIARNPDGDSRTLFDNPVTYLKEHKVPLVKKKAFTRDSKEDLHYALKIIQENAPDLAKYITIDETKERKKHPVLTLESHRGSFNEVKVKIRDKIRHSELVNVIFFVMSLSMFSSRPLLDCMLNDVIFNPRIVVIPDFRKNDYRKAMENCFKDLLACGYSPEIVNLADVDDIGRWTDECKEVDIACYCMPYYQITSFRYNPYYSVGRNFLPVMVNYGFYRSLYDRKVLSLDIYSYCWKVFFECEETIKEYKECSQINGENADLVGYIKMDRLAKFTTQYESTNTRKNILVALHHSIDGGSNDTLALANFIRYLDYFRELPDRYPEVDFTYRPHPFLLDALKRVEKWSDYDLEDWVRFLAFKSNVTWSDGGDYFQEFANSDACIQDCGSFLVEYFYTCKPCCYMLKEPEDIENKFAPLGKACLEQCYISYSTDDIDRFINDVVVGGNDTKREGRDALAKHIMFNYPHAADAALKNIKESILNCDETGH